MNYELLEKLIEKWRDIADKLDNKPVTMTANTHRLFANELESVIKKMKEKQ